VAGIRRRQIADEAKQTMSEKIGRFEIVSQLAQSPFATVYKALDPENQQTVALKAVRLEQVKDREALVKSVCDEAESAKPLSSHNIAVLYGVGEENDVLLAATEYVQGNSVATTLARHDGFSIWDIQDIARQMCQASGNYALTCRCQLCSRGRKRVRPQRRHSLHRGR